MPQTVPSFAAASAPVDSLWGRICVFAGDIKISHTVFAMPWALLSTVMASRLVPGHLAGKLGLIVVCMGTARTVAMAANRLLDARLDALNPRTARRAIPSGSLSRGFYLAMVAACILLFIAAAGGFWWLAKNPWPIILAIPVLAFVSGYPLLKRFTRLCHYYLGAALALAPICAWVAVTGRIDLPPLLMAGAVLLWTAGFDVIYACQDYQSDLQTGVISVPVKLGLAGALWVARLTHLGCVALLIVLGLTSPLLGTLYFIGVGLAVVLLVVEHSLVKPNDLSKVNLAFFTINGLISLAMGTLGVIDVLRH